MIGLHCLGGPGFSSHIAKCIYENNNNYYNVRGKVGNPRGVLRISSDRDDQRIFLGLKFSITRFFWVGKFGKYFFVWLD